MKALIDYIVQHAERGACTCGSCADAPPNPETKQPSAHTADLVFFKVSSRNNPDPEKLKQLIRDNKQGEFGDVDPFDGKEHSYLELGGWLGDQGLALMLMGLGAVLGIWKLLTPASVLGGVAKDMHMKMAQQGFVTIQSS